MSFLKIKDPAKRDAIVKEYLDLKKNIRTNLLSERTGEMEMQTDLSKFFKPITEAQKATAKEITEAQKATAKEITEGLIPIKENIESLPKSILFPAFPSIKASTEPTDEEGVHYVDNLALEHLMKYMTKDADLTFGLKTDKEGKLSMGDKNIMVDGNDIEVFDKDGNFIKKYIGTSGLRSLIVDKDPKRYDYEDLNTYEDLIRRTNAMYRGADPNSTSPAATKGSKFTQVIQTFWEKEKRRREEREGPKKKTKGKGVTVVIPSDPNALLERLDLLLASQEAGHTGVGNELVSICDELKRQGVINADTYKKLNSYIKI